ncbi:hypothetical protein N7537_001758 [Penicillium hordei]|uniref:NACHT-NTPase and P-loop NTPases N-terminal domain-containing protein n=1 Tax=Penicillium hordei TaxID=40994 RepID=A0AAD6EH96_9EURO|nr:uncharacterized protein N7537_001758 [Penicillium hordei]KAJ5616644.1 hypothetical protein N7537_001758 [Penicillium hordei]
MPSNLGVVEIPALAKVTGDLYNQCQIIAKHAPTGFQKLVTKLRLLQGTLNTFADDVNSNASFFEKMDNDRKQTFERTLGTCLATLQRLKEILARLKGFETGYGKVFWQKIKWATQRTQIEDIRSRIMVQTCNLSLCISYIGNALLARIEKAMVLAMEEGEQVVISTESSPVRDTDSVVSPISPAQGVVELPANNEEECEIDIIQEVRARIR